MALGFKEGVAAALLLLPTAAMAEGASPAISVTIDTAAAEAVFNAANADPAHAAALADAALALPAVQAMIAKDHKYFPAETADSFRTSVVALANGGSDSTFSLDDLRSRPTAVRNLLDALQQRRAELTARLRDRLASFAPPGISLHATLAVVVGSHQNGWVADQKTPIFYIDAGFQKGDFDALIATASHELFHVVQGAVQPDWGPVFRESGSASAADREAHNLHAALVNLVIEGMADYVGDPAQMPGTGAGIEQSRKEYARSLARSSENFALFDTIIFRLARDGDAPLQTLLSIGFGGAWDQTGYYVGYRMAKAIDRYMGRRRLRALVALSAEEFVLDYIAVSKAHPGDPEITPLAASTVAAVTDLKATLSKPNTEPQQTGR
ncbi:MAG: DUF5700 domain-containing putative Zn-dependent protease [Rhizomicrobium sp.]|jgi:hypothetical protein